jgi:hypothetical protein
MFTLWHPLRYTPSLHRISMYLFLFQHILGHPFHRVHDGSGENDSLRRNCGGRIRLGGITTGESLGRQSQKPMIWMEIGMKSHRLSRLFSSGWRSCSKN